jgi:dihydrofolate synthase/folylpolyglutamate synthase
MTDAVWPARMQRLKTGLYAARAPGVELWLDGGHNVACAEAIAALLADLPMWATYLICGMLNTKDVSGYMTPLAPHVAQLFAVGIPGEANTLPAEVTAQAARDAGIEARAHLSVTDALDEIAALDPNARVLICGSLYLAGHVLREMDAADL